MVRRTGDAPSASERHRKRVPVAYRYLVGNEGICKAPYIPLHMPFKGLCRVPHSLIPYER